MSLTEVLKHVKESTEQDLSISTLAIVEEIDTVKKVCLLQPFPQVVKNDGEGVIPAKLRDVRYCENLESALSLQKIVVVLFIDADSESNLIKILQQRTLGKPLTIEKPKTIKKRTKLNGIIIQVLT